MSGASGDDHRLAHALAEEAGAALVALRAEHTAAPQAGDREAERGRRGKLRDTADRLAHDVICARLAKLRPLDAVLSEEGADDAARLDASRVWIVDPLDGTREYGEPPRADWAVHVALWTSGAGGDDPQAEDGSGLVAGAVALPARGLTLSTVEPPAFPPAGEGPVRMVVSRSRPHAVTVPVAEALRAELVPLGSAGAKAMAVVLGEADVYLHAGGQYEWDSAAPVAVAAAAGLHVSRIDGAPLRYNRRDPWLPDLLVCRPELAETILAICAGW